MTKLPLDPRPVPLKELEHGALRVAGTRISFETVIEAYKEGATPEQIVDAFQPLRLADVYTLIGYYLDHKAEVDAYLQDVEHEAEEGRRRFEAAHGPPRVTREMLLERKARMEEARRNAEAGH